MSVFAQDSGSKTFMSRGALQKTFNISSHLSYRITRQSYLVKASACGPQRTAPWPPKGGEGSGVTRGVRGTSATRRSTLGAPN